MQLLITAGCSHDSHNSLGETPLTIAVGRGYISVAELLLSRNGSSSLPSDILHVALRQRRRDLQMIYWLMLRGANVQAVMSGADTVLHLAIKYGGDEDEQEDEHEHLRDDYSESDCLGLVKIFIEAGCNPTVRNSEGETVLEAAIERGYTSVVEHLLSCNVPIPPDILPIALCQYLTPDVILFLLHNGADVHSTSNGDTVLHLAITQYLESECLGLVKTFIEAGCNPTACTAEGKSVLEAAIEHGYTSVVEHLLSCNVPLPLDILPIVLQQDSPPEMVQSLVRKGADVHSTNSNGDTVLHLAIAWYPESICLDLVESFTNAGCNPTVCTAEGKSVLEAAIEHGYTSVAEHLLSCNVPLTPNILSFALQRCSPPEMIQFLVRKGVNVHSTTSDGDTMLHLAIAWHPESTCLGLVQIFIHAGCDPTARNSQGKTILEAAIERGYISVVEHLLSYNVPFLPNILLIALRRNLTIKMVEFLIHKGADVHSTTSNGNTILHLAIAVLRIMTSIFRYSISDHDSRPRR